jgi:MoaA/NifB/PqqE/SkfB family radical SAM enzyme
MNRRKFLKRLIQTICNRHRPYYAHLCVTERCNLRCSFCQIWKDPLHELSTAEFKLAIEKIDRMGVVFVIFTGGEPMLRQDICELIEYAADRGLFTAITSSGTLNLERYAALLKTRISKISISLDGIEGDDLPHSHVSTKILDTIEFLNANKGNKAFFVSATLFERNQESVPQIIEYCEKEEVKVFIQPVVTGHGKLRTLGRNMSLPSISSPYVLNPVFFNDASKVYAVTGRLDWRCHSGQLFFDIKPNGDFWLCQDYPTTLNILDPAFERKWLTYDFARYRKQCTSGCIYSCYYITQKGLEFKNIPQLIRYAMKATK